MIGLGDYPVATENSESFLNHRQVLDYRSEREDCLQWLLTYGKEPDKAEGYAEGTVKPRSYRMDRFYRFVWKLESGYTVNLTHDHPDEWMDHLAHRDVSATHKRNCQKSVKMLYKWLRHERGLGEWESDITFAADSSTQPRDYLSRDEREAIRDAAPEYGSIPSYNNRTPVERFECEQCRPRRTSGPQNRF